MKIKVKNVVILLNDNSKIDADYGEVRVEDGVSIETLKHGIELVYQDDFSDFVDREVEPLRSRIIELEAINEELYDANRALSGIIEAQSDELDEVHETVIGLQEYAEELHAVIDATPVADATLDAELEAAQQELFDEWQHEAGFLPIVVFPDAVTFGFSEPECPCPVCDGLTEDDLDVMLGEVPF